MNHRHFPIRAASVLLVLGVSPTVLGAERERGQDVRVATVSQPGTQTPKATLAKTVTLYSLYGASGVSLVASGVFGWKSLDAKNEADTEAQLGASGFCSTLVTSTCSHYANLREEQNVFALRAWGLLGTSTLLALSGLAVGEFWPNSRYPVVATLRPADSGGMVTFEGRWGL
ncbi:MAG: hypothetical protein SFV15_22750 [Polyangiaceae bacterium]|nr:hypothetical protein [Polyangiaceae bacterium]